MANAHEEVSVASREGEPGDAPGPLAPPENPILRGTAEAMEALRESDRRPLALFENLPQEVFVKDARSVYLACNRNFARDLGIEPEQIAGKTDDDFFPEALAEKHRADDRRIMASGATETIEEEQTRDGDPRFVRTIKAPFMDQNGTVAGILAISQDITDQRRAEEELARKVETLRRSNSELEHFAYVASHDLQEPLRAVSSYLQLLGRRYKGTLGPDADEFIGHAVAGAARMKQLICDLLIFSRVGMRGKPAEAADGEIVLATALANLKVAIEESGATVTHDPLPIVWGDRLQLVQLLQNLIENAIKFRGTKPPTVHVSATRREEEWVFSVRDNGIGIDPQYADRIFGLFQRLHGIGEYPGTGIGLAVAKKIVERHGGRIWVESAEGQGATFYFTVPTDRR